MVAAIDLNRHGRSVNGRYHNHLSLKLQLEFPPRLGFWIASYEAKTSTVDS
jgi:hypothetical protein